ncbi:MAG: bifunctional 4-hydroxy-2-oxoglutarate aldolase/2-dehydro-3-deoxy-phosphogluconate aldolase [Ignavibacteriaceae bacterium]|nr:bifunctional 4-hydroxy-2-oxoglutarate aldolase/2-dehydro-3-deoxy-phosphogluconate aldolase [Ignavibacteriaceae bacterium]
MKKEEILEQITKSGAIAIIRMNDSEKLKRISEAIHKGGVAAIEITMTTPNALSVIEELSRTMGKDIIVGVGSVMNSKTATEAINAGAQFVVSPFFKREIIDTVKKLNIPVMPGAFTPTEIQTAYEYGADIVKVFPADVVGMAFFKAIKGPMPYLKLMPTGGVTLTNAGEWLEAGACAVGVGTALLDKKAIEENNFKKLTENAIILVNSIAEGRKK